MPVLNVHAEICGRIMPWHMLMAESQALKKPAAAEVTNVEASVLLLCLRDQDE